MKYIFIYTVLVSLVSCDHSVKTYNEGAKLYKKHCENCHMPDGSGLEALYPPLAKSDMLESLGIKAACIIKNGLQGKILVNGIEFETGMDPVKDLSDVEITNILNYIHNDWGNKKSFIQLNEVKKSLENCKTHKK